jgi:hypothetical protein
VTTSQASATKAEGVAPCSCVGELSFIPIDLRGCRAHHYAFQVNFMTCGYSRADPGMASPPSSLVTSSSLM